MIVSTSKLFDAGKFICILLAILTIAPQLEAQRPCGEFDIRSPAGVVTGGDAVTFVADQLSKPFEEYSYEWSTSFGIIAQGQGTPSIVVGTTRANNGSTLVVTLVAKRKGDGCQSKAAASTEIKSVPIIDPDHFGKLNRWDMQAVMDNLFIRLNNNPEFHAVIVFEHEASETRRQKISRIRLMNKAVRHREYDGSRLWLAIRDAPTFLQYTPYILKASEIRSMCEKDQKLLRFDDVVRNPALAFPMAKTKKSK